MIMFPFFPNKTELRVTVAWPIMFRIWFFCVKIRSKYTVHAVQVEAWTSCERAAAAALHAAGHDGHAARAGWTLCMDHNGQLTEWAGCEYALDAVGEIETWAALANGRGEPLRASPRNVPPAPPPRATSTDDKPTRPQVYQLSTDTSAVITLANGRGKPLRASPRNVPPEPPPTDTSMDDKPTRPQVYQLSTDTSAVITLANRRGKPLRASPRNVPPAPPPRATSTDDKPTRPQVYQLPTDTSAVIITLANRRGKPLRASPRNVPPTPSPRATSTDDKPTRPQLYRLSSKYQLL
ncbi:hypothetical protein evm_000059 [Chilo suppressalis]|nr:hypothetical protein evm_000059 [Chilo suppressalis]